MIYAKFVKTCNKIESKSFSSLVTFNDHLLYVRLVSFNPQSVLAEGKFQKFCEDQMVQRSNSLREVLPHEVSLLDLRRTFTLPRECWFKRLMIPTAQSPLLYRKQQHKNIFSTESNTLIVLPL